jgi:putative restriction endonuclease
MSVSAPWMLFWATPRGDCDPERSYAHTYLDRAEPKLGEFDVPPDTEETTVRAAALAWLEEKTLGGTLELTRDQLANDFHVAGARFPLVDRGRGIRKPSGWRAALSIMTAAPKSGRARPYDDIEGPDGLHRYKLRRDQRGTSENESLRVALRDRTPLVWFYGIQAGVFNAIFPVWLMAEEPDHDQFVLALTESQRAVQPSSVVEAELRRYLITETKRRLHQPVFANQVMLAYESHCAVCNLHHRQLLDAAHIIPDGEPNGLPVVVNGLAMCKIHHAAYDRNILGIRPDYVVEIQQRLLDEADGPMLRHGLQEHHGQDLMHIPARRADRPDRVRLEERYQKFLVA